MSTTMEEKPVSGSSQINPLGHLTRQQLKELEQKEKTRGQKILDLVIMLLPVICGFIAVIEYWEVPNGTTFQGLGRPGERPLCAILRI